MFLICEAFSAVYQYVKLVNTAELRHLELSRAGNEK